MDGNPRDNHWYRMLVGDGFKLIWILIIIDYRFVTLPETRNKQEQNPSTGVLKKNSLPRSDGLGYSRDVQEPDRTGKIMEINNQNGLQGLDRI